MNRALWLKALSDVWRQLAVSAVALVLFAWLFVWLMSNVPPIKIGLILRILPGFVETIIGVKVDLLASPAGQLSLLFIDFVPLLICIGWALGRGSAVISGEIARGTMDLILSMPVWRVTVLVVPAIVTTLGSMLLAAALHTGLFVGVRLVHYENPPAMDVFLPGTLNLFCMLFCFTAITTLASSWGHDRWGTIATAGGFFIVSLILKMIARLWDGGAWLFKLSFLSSFDPPTLILQGDLAPGPAVRYDLTLLGLGLACYVAAAVIFCRRDIPGPR